MSEAAHRAFFERCPLPAAVLGPDGRFEAASHAWEDLVGWSAGELVGRPLAELLHPTDALATARPGGLAGTWGARCLRPDGSALRLVWSVAASPDGRHYCIVRQPEAEERRRHERFRAEFINLAAHALNTPLTPMQLALDTLAIQAEALAPEARQSVTVARRNFLRLRDVVVELLDAARLQAGKLALELRDEDLSALVAEAVEAQRPAAAEAGVDLEASAEPGLRGLADPARLRQALATCIGCGIGCAPRGGAVRVEAARHGGLVEVQVQCGAADLTAEQRERLFHPFQPHDDARPSWGGSGLGLYLARGILELHGGQVVAPREGAGLTLRFTLPLEGPPAPPAPPTPPAGEPIDPLGPLGAGPAVH